MADDAVASIQATVLPDEIAKTISATMTITPADANDKWYYKLTSVSNSSTDLIAGDFIDYTAVDAILRVDTLRIFSSDQRHRPAPPWKFAQHTQDPTVPGIVQDPTVYLHAWKRLSPKPTQPLLRPSL